MQAHEKIKHRRLELGLSDVEVARSSGLSIHEYFDVELHRGEVLEVTNLKNVKQLCTVLQLDPFDIVGLECAFCSGTPFLSEYLLPRNEIVRHRRLAKGWSTKDLGDVIFSTGPSTRTCRPFGAGSGHRGSTVLDLCYV
jgi:hypothetical protein